MPRLLDDIRRTHRFGMPRIVDRDMEKAWAHHTKQIAQVLYEGGFPVIVADNVSDFYYEGSDQEFWDLKKDFPCIAPPYPAFWIEHKMPKMIHSKECGDTDIRAELRQQGLEFKGRLGAMFFAVEPKDAGIVGQVPDGTKWVVTTELFVDYGFEAIEGSHGTGIYCIDTEGRLLAQPQLQGFTEAKDETVREFIEALGNWLHPAWLTISFLHCKNVTIVDNPVPPKLAKRYKERHGLDPLDHKTLIIEPLKQILRTEGRSGEHGLQKALHICRGHFKDYREGAGLFGKYHKIVWQPSIVRGTTRGKEKSPEREIVVKV